jgi:hypothetical protein
MQRLQLGCGLRIRMAVAALVVAIEGLADAGGSASPEIGTLVL